MGIASLVLGIPRSFLYECALEQLYPSERG